jgi:hypothetical protein
MGSIPGKASLRFLLLHPFQIGGPADATPNSLPGVRKPALRPEELPPTIFFYQNDAEALAKELGSGAHAAEASPDDQDVAVDGPVERRAMPEFLRQ